MKTNQVSLIIMFFALIFSFCFSFILFSFEVYQFIQSTPEKSLNKIIKYVSVGDMPKARSLISDKVWLNSDVFLPMDLFVLLSNENLKKDNFNWSKETDESVSFDWNQNMPIPELNKTAGITINLIDKKWILSGFESEWSDEVVGIALTLKYMRDAIDSKSGSDFLKYVKQGDGTCIEETCLDIVKKINNGLEEKISNIIKMNNIDHNSFIFTNNYNTVTMTWLQETKYLKQYGVVELKFSIENEKYFLISANDEHYMKINNEMDIWTENHNEMIWREKVYSYVEIKSLPSFCDYWYYSVCLSTVFPTQVKNIGSKKIKSIKVSKVKSKRYMGNASQTLWGVYSNISPGQSKSDPSSASGPVYTKSYGGKTWEFYRVEWIEIENEDRKAYSNFDYRNAMGGTITFDIVMEKRKKAGVSLDEYYDIVKSLANYGYTIPTNLLTEAPPPPPSPSPAPPAPLSAHPTP